MNPLHEQLIQIGTRILSLCRSELYLSMRYLDLALSALSYDLNLQTRTIATDRVHLFYNPNYLIHSYEDDPIAVNRMYLHIILHCIFRHMTQAEQRDPEDWNLACDIAVESVIDSMDYPCIQRLITDRRQEYYDSLQVSVLNAEQVYDVLTKMTYSQKIGMRREFSVDDHRFWEQLQDDKQQQPNGDNRADSPSPPPPSKDEVEQTWQDISQKTQTSMETIQRDISLMAGNLRQHLQIENRQRYDYRAFLRKFAVTREEVRVDPDSFDYGFYNYSLQLYPNMPMLEELEYRDSFFRTVNVHIIQCDAGIQSDTKITDPQHLNDMLQNFDVSGNGDTDFRPVFDYIEQLQQRGELLQLQGLLFFTDGVGVYPKKRPPYDAAFIFFDNSYAEHLVPPWAMKLVLSESDLTRG